MKLPKFKRDDIVETPMKTKCRVRRFYAKDGNHYYEVELLSSYKKGEITDFNEDVLSFHYSIEEGTKKKDNIPPECPKCGSKWHISRFGMRKWYDCPRCNDKAENLCKMELKTEIPPIPVDAYHKDYFSDVLWDYDDDDDLFLKKRKGYTVPEYETYEVNSAVWFENGSKIEYEPYTIKLPSNCIIDNEKIRGLHLGGVIIDDPLANIELSEEEKIIVYEYYENDDPFRVRGIGLDPSEALFNCREKKKKGYTRQLTEFDLYYIKDEEKL